MEIKTYNIASTAAYRAIDTAAYVYIGCQRVDKRIALALVVHAQNWKQLGDIGPAPTSVTVRPIHGFDGGSTATVNS
jgi:hypothetical protein